MTPFEVLVLLAGLVVLAIIFGYFWQKWEDRKLARSGALAGLKNLRKEFRDARIELDRILDARP